MSQSATPGATPPWTAWSLKAALAASAALGIGMLLLGLPDAVFKEFVNALGLARKLAPDAVWPLAILITFAGRLAIISASLLLRPRRPHTIADSMPAGPS